MVSPVDPLLKSIEDAEKASTPYYNNLYDDIQILKDNLSIDAPNGFKSYSSSGKIEDLNTTTLPESASKNQKIEYMNRLRQELTRLGLEDQVHENLQNKAQELQQDINPREKPVEALNSLQIEHKNNYHNIEEFLQKYTDILYTTVLDKEFSQEDLELRKNWYSSLDTDFPIIQGLNQTKEQAQSMRTHATQNLPNTSYEATLLNNNSRQEIEAFKPEEWHCILSFGYGDLHEWMDSSELDTKENITQEYSLDFLEPNRHQAKVLRPDAVEDLFVHEFKQPENRRLPRHLHKSGALTTPEESDLQQVNLYLKKLDLPLGFLTYLSSEGMQRYAIEQTNKEIPQPENIHLADSYEINISQLLEK